MDGRQGRGVSARSGGGGAEGAAREVHRCVGRQAAERSRRARGPAASARTSLRHGDDRLLVDLPHRASCAREGWRRRNRAPGARRASGGAGQALCRGPASQRAARRAARLAERRQAAAPRRSPLERTVRENRREAGASRARAPTRPPPRESPLSQKGWPRDTRSAGKKVKKSSAAPFQNLRSERRKAK